MLIMPAGVVVFSVYTVYTIKRHGGDVNNYRCLKNSYPSHALLLKIEEVSKYLPGITCGCFLFLPPLRQFVVVFFRPPNSLKYVHDKNTLVLLTF